MNDERHPLERLLDGWDAVGTVGLLFVSLGIAVALLALGNLAGRLGVGLLAVVLGAAFLAARRRFGRHDGDFS